MNSQSSDSSQPQSVTPKDDSSGTSGAADSAAPRANENASGTPASGSTMPSPGGLANAVRKKSEPPRKIQIGSRRDRSHDEPQPSKPPLVTSSPVEAVDVPPSSPVEAIEVPPSSPPEAIDVPLPVPQRPGPVPLPSVRDPLSPDLEQEFEAALSGTSMDELMGAGPVVPGMGIEPGTKLKATVIRLRADDVFCSLGGPSEGVASLRQFDEPPEIGAQIEIVVRSFNVDEGLYEVALPGAAIEVDDLDDLEEGAVVEARITGANTGGLECKVQSLRGFIPSSQIALYRVEDFAEYIDQKLICIVTEVNPRRKNLVLSRRAVLEREREESRKELLASLEVGKTVDGVVSSLRDFGAFVDLGGVDGLIHISRLSWDRIEHPNEVLEQGQKVRVKIEKIDPETGKIGLSYRDLLEHPWTSIGDKLSVDSEITGVVSRIAQFGAFVKVAPGIDGLVHISELSHARVSRVGSVVSEGQEVNVKVLSIDTENQRIALSMKAVLPLPETEAQPATGEDSASEPLPESAVPKRQGPLKGGTGGDSGGNQFGLKW